MNKACGWTADLKLDKKNKNESCLPESTIEHIGSTAVPDCPGKGVINLMLKPIQ